MPAGACLLVTVVDAVAGDRSAHVQAVREVLGAQAKVAELTGVDRSRSAIVGVGDGPGPIVEARARSPLAGAWHVTCGVDPDAIAHDVSDAPGGYVDLVLDPAEPPIPFDDPTVVGVLRDYQRSYLNLLGQRYLRCEALWRDAVRAAGSFVAFTATHDQEARWLAAANPWRRVAAGCLLRLPPGLFRRSLPPPGPGTQRRAQFACTTSPSSSEPGVDRRSERDVQPPFGGSSRPAG